LPTTDRVSFEYAPLNDGDTLHVGSAGLRVFHTPGHTPESASYLLDERALFTGDTLFLAAVGRPDLEATPDESQRRAQLLHASLRRLVALPPDILVLPAHRSWRQAPIAAPLPETSSPIRLGLGPNWRQFALLIVVNAFVGAMVGLERTVLPLIAQADFGLVSKTVVLSFLVSFGVVKALANLFAGQLADRIGRKPLLVAGWFAGLPVPLLIIWAPSWGWIVFANVLLGVNQGLCWSTTVIMKIDLVGPARRGLAMGLHEFAGYVAVSLSALLTGYLAAAHGLRPAPFYPGIAFALVGLVLSVFAVRDTQGHARA